MDQLTDGGEKLREAGTEPSMATLDQPQYTTFTTATVHNTRSHVSREGPELPGAEATHSHHTTGHPDLFQSPNGECTRASVYAFLFVFFIFGIRFQSSNSKFIFLENVRMLDC